MKMNKSENKYSGRSGMGCLGFFAVLLGVAFIVLKLVGVIDWSWWWVLAPIWGYVALGFVIFLVALAIAIIVELIDKNK